MARASALQAEGRRFDSVYLHNEKDFGFPEVFFWFYLQSTDIGAQRKIPVDLHFIVRLRHKASGAALGLSCAVCFEQSTGVFAGCGAVCFIRHIILYRRRREVPAATFAGAHPSGCRRHLPFTRSWVTTGLRRNLRPPLNIHVEQGALGSARPLFVMH